VKPFFKSAFGGFGNAAISAKWSRITSLACPILKKRLIKTPRFYVRDSGILHRLLGINHYDALLSNPILGKSWEGGTSNP
jgi:hypothetical protein